MINDFEHLFVCLMDIFMFSLEKGFFSSLPFFFFNTVVCFVHVELYVFFVNPLLNISFAMVTSLCKS